MTNDENFDLDALLAEAKAAEDAREPVDVEVVLGDKVVTVRMPYLKNDAFEPLVAKHSRFPFRDAIGCWFDLDAVTRDHPDIVLIDGDKSDDLYVLRDREAVYRWADVYDALGSNDKQSLQAAFWGVYIYEPQQQLEKARAKKEADNG